MPSLNLHGAKNALSGARELPEAHDSLPTSALYFEDRHLFEYSLERRKRS